MREISLTLVLLLAGCTEPAPAPGPDSAPAPAPEGKAAQEAFLASYRVFMHPRCLNCHPAGDAPLQGEDSHLHAQHVTRGPDGKGLFALRCSSCHQDRNLPGPNTPPGHPSWHLPGPEAPLVFEGRSPAQLAAQLKDPKQTGGKTLEQVLEHVEKDGLVLACFSPPEGRPPPPLSHAEFARAFRTWVEAGAPVPE